MSSTHTVLLHLHGPMQAWGTVAPWDTRPVLRRPTKCGVIGFVANALGRDRADDISDLAALSFGVRIDRPGRMFIDDQTAGGGTFLPLPADYAVNPELAANPGKWIYGAPRSPILMDNGQLTAPWKPATRQVVMRSKGYLAGAAFLVGLTGDADDAGLIEEVAAALTAPARLLFLGRKNCPIGGPPLYGVTTEQDWASTTPLLPGATDPQPRVWYETSPVADSIGFPEQPVDIITRRRVVHLRWTRVTPVAMTEEGSQV